MTPVLTYKNIPEFAPAGYLIAPEPSAYSNGYLPGEEYPAENHNWFMNGLTYNGVQAQTMINSTVTEIDNFLTSVGVTPDGASTSQLGTALLGLTHTTSGTYQIGASGVKLKNSSGSLLVRNALDSAYSGLTAGAIVGTTYNGLTVTTSTGTLTIANGITLSITDSTTIATNQITFAGTEYLRLTASKNVSFGGSLTTTGDLTFTGAYTLGLTLTANSTLTLPTSGTLATTANIKPCTSTYGCILSNNSGTPNSKIDITAGSTIDSTGLYTMDLSAITKSTSSFAVGTGNGALDTGSWTADKWYAVFVIKRLDTGVVDVLFSLSATAPTMPANYTIFKLIGYVYAVVSTGNIRAFFQNEDTFTWSTQVQDRATAAYGVSTRIVPTISAPPLTQSIVIARYTGTAGGSFGWIGEVACADVNPTASMYDFFAPDTYAVGGEFFVYTSSTSTIATRSGTTTATLSIHTKGFKIKR